MANIILCTVHNSRKLPNNVKRIYCGRDYPAKNPTIFNQGLGNMYPSKQYSDWKELYHKAIQEEYFKYWKVYDLINEAACEYALGTTIALECHCYTDRPVVYGKDNTGKCHTDILADIILKNVRGRLIVVFGSNKQGFHGSGLAGLMCRGNSGEWRGDTWFEHAAKKGTLYEERIGKRAVVGVSRGFQKGIEGMSYGICTVESFRPREYTPIEDIATQLYNLLVYCDQYKNCVFCLTPVGTGLGGKSPELMQQTWENVCKEWQEKNQRDTLPFNLYRTDCFQKKINVSHT